MKEEDRVIVVNGLGEVLCDDVALYRSRHDVERIDKYKEAREQVEAFKGFTKSEQFVVYLYSMHKSMTDLQPQTAIRMVYLATYLEFDGQYLKEHGKYISRQSMQELMMLKPATFTRFLEEVTNAGYVLKDGRKYYINSEIFHRGYRNSNDVMQDYVRVYVDTLRNLYRSVPQKKHVYLGYIFQLIPYINREWNIICFNPDETDEDYISPMRVGDFCEIVGYERKNAARFIKEYRDIKFEWNGDTQSFLGYFYEDDKAEMRFFANPNIFYAGNDFNRVKILKLAFGHRKTDKNMTSTAQLAYQEHQKLLQENPELQDLF